jgi:hypothetical protein
MVASVSALRAARPLPAGTVLVLISVRGREEPRQPGAPFCPDDGSSISSEIPTSPCQTASASHFAHGVCRQGSPPNATGHRNKQQYGHASNVGGRQLASCPSGVPDAARCRRRPCQATPPSRHQTDQCSIQWQLGYGLKARVRFPTGTWYLYLQHTFRSALRHPPHPQG